MEHVDDPTLASLFEEDQSDRSEYLKLPTPENWRKVLERGKARRECVIELMQQQKLNTAADYFGAGIIMLHGSTSEEFILGHVFAMTSMAKGNSDAAWLSALTLDRMMQGLGQGQVFDTQPPEMCDNVTKFKTREKTVFITDSMREIFAPRPHD